MEKFIKIFLLAAVLVCCGSAAQAQQSATQNLTLTVQGSAVTITTTHLPNAISTTAYSQPLTASGGSGTFTFSVTAGSLPAGLTLSTGGVLSGTPTTAGTSSFTVQAKDSNNQTATQAFSGFLTYQKLAFTSSTLPVATFNTAYTASVGFSGGTAPYACSLASGTLPTGLTISQSGNACVISGTPSQAGSFSFSVKVADNSQLALVRIDTVLYAQR